MERNFDDEMRLDNLIVKYLQGEDITPEEHIQLNAWLDQASESQEWVDRLKDNAWISQQLEEFGDTELKNQNWQTILDKMGRRKVHIMRRSFIRSGFYAAASVLALLVTFLAIKYVHKRKDNVTLSGELGLVAATDIAPGNNKATLTLSNGSIITLGNAANGNLAVQGNSKVLKLDSGRLAYNATSEESTDKLYNTLSTPRGGQFQVRLPDGTQVWLNNVSSLRYPTYFDKEKREVELTGEAYFEVAHAVSPTGKRIPFIVRVLTSAEQKEHSRVEVLGTHFNIMAYEDEKAEKISLLEGSVRVCKGLDSALLKPGQQAILSLGNTDKIKSDKISIDKDADIDEAVSWKNGMTSFANADIQTIMRKIARWYDISVTYQGVIPERNFMGSISRNSTWAEMLEVLKLNKIHFEMDGKTLTIKP